MSEKVNIWDDWNLMHRKDKEFLERASSAHLYPFINRLRGREKHYQMLDKISTRVFSSNPKALVSYMFFALSPDPFCGTPKPTKYDNEKLDIVVKYLQKILVCGEREILTQKEILIPLLEDKNFLNQLNNIVSLDKKECKILEVNYGNFKPKPIEQPKKRDSADLFSF